MNGKILLYIEEMRHVVNRGRMDYNHYRTHSSVKYMTRARFAQIYHDIDCVQAKRLRCKDEGIHGNSLIKVETKNRADQGFIVFG